MNDLVILSVRTWLLSRLKRWSSPRQILMGPEFETSRFGIENFGQSMMTSGTSPTLPRVTSTDSLAEAGSAEAQASVKSLDIGCGRSKTSGCIGIDRVSLPGVDIVHDLNQFPWPFPDDEFFIIYANHFLEHVGHILETLAEIHRICMPDGRLIIRVPHYASDNFHTDLTHKVAFGYRSFDHFSINGKTAYDFYVPFKFEILHRRIKYMSPLRRFDPFQILGVETLVNMFPRVYERFFVYLLPPAEIRFELRVVK